MNRNGNNSLNSNTNYNWKKKRIKKTKIIVIEKGMIQNLNQGCP